MAAKATVDLEKLSLDELNTLSNDIERAIARKKTENVRKAREAAEAAAKQYGLSLQDVLGGAGKRKSSRPAADAKFRNPEAPDQTWSGRGRQPQWFKDALAAGKSTADLAI